MRTVDLWRYLPPCLKEFVELVGILDAEEPEFQGLAGQCDGVLRDGFITTATARGIARFERIMGIRPDSAASLETRRSAVLTKWWNTIPYTIRTLKSRIALIQGNDDVQVSFDADAPYIIRITTRLETAGQMDDLKYILETMLPANLGFDSRNRLDVELDVPVFMGVGAVVTGTLHLTGGASALTNTLELH